MQWASALSFEPDPGMALTELKRSLFEQLDGARPDLVCAFVSPQYSASYGTIPDLVRNHFSSAAFIGCTAAGVIGGGREVEEHIAGQAAFSLTAAALPGVEIHSFHLDARDLPDADAGPELWVEALRVPRQPQAHFLLLADPHTFDPQPLLMGLDFAYGDATKIGGLASAMDANCLFLDRKSHSSGLVGLALQGGLEVDTVVAQGCRPIGVPMTVTGCRHNLLLQLNERPAAEVLVELFHTLSPDDQQLLRHALHLGIASTEFKEKFEQGDFLIRNVLNLDQEKGFIAVGDVLRSGQTVQFHLRETTAGIRPPPRRRAPCCSPAAAAGNTSLAGAITTPAFSRTRWERFPWGDSSAAAKSARWEPPPTCTATPVPSEYSDLFRTNPRPLEHPGPAQDHRHPQAVRARP